MKLSSICITIIVLLGLCISLPAWSQVTTQNLSNIKVDELSDDQIRQFISQVEASGLGQAQLEQVAQARGMRPEEIQKLRERADRLSKSGQQNRPSNSQPGRTYNPADSLTFQNKRDTLSGAEKALLGLKAKIFGAALFSNNNRPTFEPNLRLATPANYQVGPDDQLLIDIYGNSEVSYKLTVSPEGTINVPYVGVIPVGGMTIEQATARIRSRLATIYSGIRSGNTSVSIALGNIRSIKVILTGEVVKPGTYTLPSVATVFNALYQSGGPTENGSFRQIEVLRAGRRIASLDVYDFLLNGTFRNNIRLQDQDVIRVPTYIIRTEVTGHVKRSGIFEMLPNEKLADLIRFAGDFTESAYKARLKVLKNTVRERKISDITADQFSTYQPSTGDKYFVDEILDRFENRVTIEGAVFRPGQYELSPGLTISQLIRRAEGVREDAFLNRAYIIRLKDDQQTAMESFDVAKVLAGQIPDIALKREDVITISSIFDLKEEYNVRIEGEVQYPGTFKYAEGMNLEDAILQAGGLKEGATAQRVEISRRVKNSNALSKTAQTTETFHVNISPDLKATAAAFILQPFDIVAVRPSAGYEVQRLVKVEGEVLFPGIYAISRKDERVSDLLKRAGGFTALAYPEGASLKRPGSEKDISVTGQEKNRDYKNRQQQLQNERLNQVRRLQMQVTDTANLAIQEEAIRNNYVGINMPKILKSAGGRDDIFLEEGDILTIPKQLQTVKVSGEVLSPVTVVYSSRKGFKQYISNGGGFSVKALKRRSYIIYANGNVNSTRKFLFFNNYPSVKPGAEIFVPKRDERNKLTSQELLGLTTGIASLGAIILGILNLSK